MPAKKKTVNRTGLIYPTGRTRRLMKKQLGKKTRIGETAPVFLAAVLEYVNAEVLELAGNSTKEHKRKRVINRDIALAVKNDEELHKLFAHGTFASGGVVPNIESQLLPPRKKTKKGGASEQY